MRISFGQCVLDTERRQLECAGEPVHLSPKALAVLEVLIAERPRPVSKRLLLDRVWSGVVVEEQNVKNTIVEIRAALGYDADAIRTVQRFGYAFAAEAAEESAGPGERPLYWLSYESKVVPITSAELDLGREPTCRFCVDFPGVSRRHARITAANGEAQIEDLQSKTGTWIDNRRIDSATPLRDGDRIRIGSALLVFRSRSNADSTISEGS